MDLSFLELEFYVGLYKRHGIELIISWIVKTLSFSQGRLVKGNECDQRKFTENAQSAKLYMHFRHFLYLHNISIPFPCDIFEVLSQMGDGYLQLGLA